MCVCVCVCVCVVVVVVVVVVVEKENVRYFMLPLYATEMLTPSYTLPATVLNLEKEQHISRPLTVMSTTSQLPLAQQRLLYHLHNMKIND